MNEPTTSTDTRRCSPEKLSTTRYIKTSAMAQINDFADLFNLEDLNTFDKEDCSTPTPNLSPKHAGIGSGSPPAAKNANFLVKL